MRHQQDPELGRLQELELLEVYCQGRDRPQLRLQPQPSCQKRLPRRSLQYCQRSRYRSHQTAHRRDLTPNHQAHGELPPQWLCWVRHYRSFHNYPWAVH